MEYKFRDIEKKWQAKWNEKQVYKVSNESSKPKYYVLDMFPYPSGAGLHVGHPLGYIASDIYARFKRLKGFNVLHPMGYDAFGLPAEQYALEHGIHPSVSTEQNIHNFRRQLDNIGFSFDWDREVRTSQPSYYKWTQWIFLQLFNSFYDRRNQKTARIGSLIKIFEKEGNKNYSCPGDTAIRFTEKDWASFDEKRQEEILMNYRVAYCGYGEVNWCEALGTVLANDEVVNGVSERGGYPVVRKKLRQWYLRITEYADRLIEGLDRIEFSEAMKEMQSNWIGKSYGAEIDFRLSPGSTSGQEGIVLKVYTTRPDTIFGADFLVTAPEHELLHQITSVEQKAAIEEYIAYVKSRSERERIAEKKITGCFTGAFALHPFNGKQIPIWVSEYVLAGYGTGAIMAVPCGDERDFRFAKHFNIPVTNIIGKYYHGEEANPTKDAILENSDFLNGMVMRDAIEVVIERLEKMGVGTRKINFRMRDAAFSRQRYWGEPFPIVWKDGVAYPLDEKDLPLELPLIENYKPGPDGEGPLANVDSWKARHLETNTMPGYAGSSWYFLRYMDPHNDKEFCSRAASGYWGQVDLYIGGTEHAVGHLLYSRMWTKALHDLGFISHDEPFKKLVNQGMIQGSSRLAYRVDFQGEESINEKIKNTPVFISYPLMEKTSALGSNKTIIKKIKDLFHPDPVEISEITINPLHVDVNIVNGVELNIEAFKKWKPEYANAMFILEEDGKYICGVEVEKMSKSKYNTVNPDDLINRYGADTFRMYEMFLGPVEQSKPWDTKGIEGVHRFLKKLWRLFYDEQKGKIWNNDKATDPELKVLHKTIKKIEEDTERFSFNTGVSSFMICVNELHDLKCYKTEVLEKLLIILAPYAPHICEELNSHLQGFREAGQTVWEGSSILINTYPKAEEKYLIESLKNYPVAINGKTRAELKIALDATQQQVEEIVLTDETIKKWLEGKQVKKLIYVKGKMINIVL
jgi:leucyl-tRNA synthetase